VTEIKMEDCGRKRLFCFKAPIKEVARKRVKISGRISNTWNEARI
jgi:hypothetical protein